MSATRRPRRASSAAHAHPAGPPPTMTTWARSSVMADLLDQPGQLLAHSLGRVAQAVPAVLLVLAALVVGQPAAQLVDVHAALLQLFGDLVDHAPLVEDALEEL